jgi:hypothetical protein
MDFDLFSVSQGPLRDAFWQLASAGPAVSVGVGALLVIKQSRTLACFLLAAGCVGAAVTALIVHFGYVVLIWSGHESAIWMLDEAAALTGFAAGVLATALAAAGVALARRSKRVRGRPPT